MDKHLQHLWKQFANHSVRGSSRVGLRIEDPHVNGEFCARHRVCARWVANLRASRTQHLAAVGDMRCKLARSAPCQHILRGTCVRYAIKAIRVLASSTRAVVQDCVEAEDNTDARDKFFMHA